MLGDGLSNTGKHSSLASFVQESDGATVWRESVDLASAEAARKELDEETANDVRNGGMELPKVSDAPNEQRAVIMMPAKPDCTDPMNIRFIEGAMVRSVYSCSWLAAFNFYEGLQSSLSSMHPKPAIRRPPGAKSPPFEAILMGDGGTKPGFAWVLQASKRLRVAKLSIARTCTPILPLPLEKNSIAKSQATSAGRPAGI